MAAPAKQIKTTVGFQDPEGNLAASGVLILTLSQNAEVTASGGQVFAKPQVFKLDTSGLITQTAIWFNDELTPSGTTYGAKLYASNGSTLLADFGQWSFTGAGPLDLSTLTPSSSSVSYSAAVLLSPSGSQTITTGSLTLTTGSFVETASAVTGSGGLVRKTSPTLTTPTISGGAFSGSQTGMTITSPTISAGSFSGNQTGVTLTGASNGNAVTLLNSQGNLTNVTGNGTDQTVFTYTIPANTVGAGKGIRVRYAALSNNAVSCVWKLILGATTIQTGTTSAAQQQNGQVEIMNNAGVQNAQTASGWQFDGATILNNTVGATSAETFVNALVIKLTANEANPNTVTPKQFIVELIQ